MLDLVIMRVCLFQLKDSMAFCKPSSFNANGHLTSMTPFPQQEQDAKLSAVAANHCSFCFNNKPDS